MYVTKSGGCKVCPGASSGCDQCASISGRCLRCVDNRTKPSGTKCVKK